MQNISKPAIRELLINLKYLVLDEAHVYESVFGSNVSYLLRRMFNARSFMVKSLSEKTDMQVIAATATILNPCEHMKNLTGHDFQNVGSDFDGAPTYHKMLYHINGPEGIAGEQFINELCSKISNVTDGAFIAFRDSRQGVERIARNINNTNVLPYRSGYEASDRKLIELRLKQGDLRGVVSTSALELGIDIGNLQVGVNLGIPQTKKAFRQRLGRVGRSSFSVFVLVAPRHSFARLGSSFYEYYAGSIEPSYLYLENRFIQFAHARCLCDEAELLQDDAQLLSSDSYWSQDFSKIFEQAKPGGRRSREFDFIQQLGADSPHINYPLRQVGVANYEIKHRNGIEKIGDIALNHAIREAYPGSLYLHNLHSYSVLEWRSSLSDRSIRVEKFSKAPTKPILTKTVNLSLLSDDIIDSNVLSNEMGFLGEFFIQVNEAVIGYRSNGKTYLYRDLRQDNPAMKRKQRDFRTTATVIKINADWFSGTQSQQQNRVLIAEALLEIVRRDRSISPNDIDFAISNIAIYQNGQLKRVTDAIVIYDSIYGGLRLTEPLFKNFKQYIERLYEAAKILGEEASVPLELMGKLCDWFTRLKKGIDVSNSFPKGRDGEILIYTPGSIVSIVIDGQFQEREIINKPQFKTGLSGESVLCYEYRNVSDGTSWVPHSSIQATGQDWQHSFWNPETNEMRELNADS